MSCEPRDAGMQWPAWDTVAAVDTLLDCRTIASRERNHLIYEIKNGVSFESIRTFLRRKCEALGYQWSVYARRGLQVRLGALECVQALRRTRH